MQPITELISSFQRRNVMLWVSGDQLRYRAPQGEVNSGELEILRSRKVEIMAHLTEMPSSLTEFPPFSVRKSTSQLVPSFTQERLWRSARSGWFNVNLPVLSMRFHGQLNVEALEKSIQALESQHEILRTRFAEGQSCRLILDQPSKLIENVTLAESDTAKRDQALSCCVGEIMARDRDIFRDKPFQAHLITLEPGRDYAVIVMVSHIAADATSCDLLRQQIFKLYRTFSKRSAVHQIERQIQYSDYAAWQRDWLTPLSDQLTAYWSNQLARTPALALPLDKPGTLDPRDVRSVNISTFHLGEGVVKSIDDAAMRMRTTRFVVLAAAFKCVLSVWTSQKHLAIASVGDDRVANSDLLSVIGPFMVRNYLRTDLSGNPSFEEAVGRVQEAYTRALANPSLTTSDSEFTRRVNVEINYIPSPKFDGGDNGEETGKSESDSIKSSPISLPAQSRPMKFLYSKLRLRMFDSANGSIVGRLEYDEDVFEQESIKRVASMLIRVLEVATKHPQKTLCDVI